MPAHVRIAAAVAFTLPVLAVAGCSGNDADQTVGVTMTDSACTLDNDDLQPGKTAFDIKNTSGREAEVYVYTNDGDKVDEVEGIADGVSRTLTVSLHSGNYQLACKPEGKDIRATFSVG